MAWPISQSQFAPDLIVSFVVKDAFVAVKYGWLWFVKYKWSSMSYNIHIIAQG